MVVLVAYVKDNVQGRRVLLCHFRCICNKGIDLERILAKDIQGRKPAGAAQARVAKVHHHIRVNVLCSHLIHTTAVIATKAQHNHNLTTSQPFNKKGRQREKQTSSVEMGRVGRRGGGATNSRTGSAPIVPSC